MNRLQQHRAEIARAAAENAAAQAEARARAAAGGAATNGKPKAVKAGPGSVARWVTFNTFIDAIAPRLTLAERSVWLVLFRHARGGICETSERSLSEQVRIDKATTGRALRQLVELGLVWPVFKSSRKGEASRYGVHPRPEARLAAVIAMDERRREAGRQRRQRNGGDRRGRRRKGRGTG